MLALLYGPGWIRCLCSVGEKPMLLSTSSRDGNSVFVFLTMLLLPASQQTSETYETYRNTFHRCFGVDK